MSEVGLTFEGNLAVVTLQRPERRNALSLDLMLELAGRLDGIAQKPEVRVVILEAAGKVFSSGHDLGEMTGRGIEHYRRIFDVCTELMTKIQSIPQPVIAQVQGVTSGMGRKRAMEMLLAGRAIDASTAEEWGLVNRVVAPEELPAETRKLAAQIAEASSFTGALGEEADY